MTLIPQFTPRQIPSTLQINQLVDAINTVAELGSMSYQGAWNAATNTPTLVSGIGPLKGAYYSVTTPGSTNIDGISDWMAQDKIVFNGDVWERFDGGYNEVLSVAGLIGTISKAALIAALAGTAAGDLIKLDPTGKIPAVDGSLLTNLPSSPISSVFGRTGAVTLDAADLAAAAFGPFTDIASAATCDLGSVPTVGVRITGTVGVTSFGATGASLLRIGKFAGILTLTHNATSLILPTGANIVTAAGDRFIALSDGSDNWTVINYIRADGTSIDANALRSSVSKNLTAGFTATSYNAGSKSTGTFTPDPALGNFQHCTNDGAFTLAPPATTCSMVIDVTNSASAGAITTSGFTKTSGDTRTTTNGNKFRLFITVGAAGSHLHTQALQ